MYLCGNAQHVRSSDWPRVWLSITDCSPYNAVCFDFIQLLYRKTRNRFLENGYLRLLGLGLWLGLMV